MRSLSRILAPDRIAWLRGQELDEVLRELAELHCRNGSGTPIQDLLQALREREELSSTAIGQGLALPHARLPGEKEFRLSLGLHRRGVAFGAFDGKPVHVFALLVGPADKNELYVQFLARISRFLREKKDLLLQLGDPQRIYELTLDY